MTNQARRLTRQTGAGPNAPNSQMNRGGLRNPPSDSEPGTAGAADANRNGPNFGRTAVAVVEAKAIISGAEAGVQSFIVAHLAGGQSAGAVAPISIFIPAIIATSAVMSIVEALLACGIIAPRAIAMTQQMDRTTRISHG